MDKHRKQFRDKFADKLGIIHKPYENVWREQIISAIKTHHLKDEQDKEARDE